MDAFFTSNRSDSRLFIDVAGSKNLAKAEFELSGQHTSDVDIEPQRMELSEKGAEVTPMTHHKQMNIVVTDGSLLNPLASIVSSPQSVGLCAEEIRRQGGSLHEQQHPSVPNPTTRQPQLQ